MIQDHTTTSRGKVTNGTPKSVYDVQVVTEHGMAYGWRHLWSRSPDMSRGSHAPPGRQ